MGNIILSQRVNNMAESATLKMTQLSRELKAQGIDVISLSIGEPDFNTPVAAKQAITNVFMAIVDKGDEVIIPAPFWVSYPEMVKLADGTPVFINTTAEQNFKITAEQLEAAITPKTKAFIFSTPCNPSGSVYTKAELAALAEVFKKYPNIIILSDEIYEFIQYEQKHESMGQFTELKDRLVIINGVAKGYAMTGWRIGYIAAPKAIVSACNKIQGQYTSGICTIAQAASLEAMKMSPENSEEIQTMLKAFRNRRDMFFELLSEIPGIKLSKPAGAFYMFPEIKSFFGKTDGETTINNSDDLCLYLLDKAHVACVGGAAFGNDECIRLSYATSEDKLRDAAARIKEALSKLK